MESQVTWTGLCSIFTSFQFLRFLFQLMVLPLCWWYLHRSNLAQNRALQICCWIYLIVTSLLMHGFRPSTWIVLSASGHTTAWQSDTGLITQGSPCCQLPLLPGDGWVVKGEPRGGQNNWVVWEYSDEEGGTHILLTVALWHSITYFSSVPVHLFTFGYLTLNGSLITFKLNGCLLHLSSNQLDLPKETCPCHLHSARHLANKNHL